jgi:DNA-binding NarL/FixJ family response regulator
MVLVEEHAVMRAVLREVVEGQPVIDIVAEAADVDDAIATIREEVDSGPILLFHIVDNFIGLNLPQLAYDRHGGCRADL